MRRSSLTVALLALAGLPFVADAQPLPATHGAPLAVALPDADVLYEQTSNDSGTATVSQNFESGYDAYDAQAADDFTVPSGQLWKLTEIIAIGRYFNGTGLADSENVTFYKDRGGRPGKVISSAVDVHGADDGAGNFTVKLVWVPLETGTYWVSVQANMSFLTGGEWGWENQSTVEGNRARWRNPGNGFQTACTKYKAESHCVGIQGDQMFVLKGVIR
jgi:hypothetical protein